jgi:hypothetical protein
MKAIALFFSLYMTLLAFMPCRDKQDNAALVDSQPTIQRSHSCNNQASQETCSPFCTCSCRSAVRVLHQQPPLVFAFVQVYREYPIQLIPALQQISPSIWQPPQLS